MTRPSVEHPHGPPNQQLACEMCGALIEFWDDPLSGVVYSRCKCGSRAVIAKRGAKKEEGNRKRMANGRFKSDTRETRQNGFRMEMKACGWCEQVKLIRADARYCGTDCMLRARSRDIRAGHAKRKARIRK